MSHYNMLCLGDSYTIGEGVPLHDSFPYLLTQLLRSNGLNYHAPEIIAKTGWTSFELKDQLLHTQLLEKYTCTTLLIGVNNQYRNLSVQDYANDFEWLLKKAIQCANHKNENVIVLSIPDWGVTPFAEGRDRNTITEEIDEFNRLNETITLNYQANYINITTGTREAANDDTLLANDKLHYSAKEHKRWAELIYNTIVQIGH